jgi:hypothetical protein
MKKLLIAIFLLGSLTASAQLNLPYGIKVLTSKPLNYYYFQSDNTPWESVAQANSGINIGLRHRGMTLLIDTTEYWYMPDTLDVSLTVKTLGSAGSSYTFAGGLLDTGGVVTADSVIAKGMSASNMLDDLGGGEIYSGEGLWGAGGITMLNTYTDGFGAGYTNAQAVLSGNFFSVSVLDDDGGLSPSSLIFDPLSSQSYSMSMYGAGASTSRTTFNFTSTQATISSTGGSSNVYFQVQQSGANFNLGTSGIISTTSLLPLADTTVFLLGQRNSDKAFIRVDRNTITGGSGTVTSVSSANADITVATGTTTPVLTMVQSPALRSATTTINVSSATAPTVGQVLTATSSTAATWQTVAGSGDVLKVGTPVDNQIGVWTGDGTIEGTSGLTYNGTALGITGNITVSGTVDGIDIATDVAANTAKVTNATHTGDVTGATALTIGADKILESHLKSVNAPTDEYFLTYEATTGDFEWQTAVTSVSSANTDLTITSGTNAPVLTIEEAPTTRGLESLTTTVDVSGSTAPTSGQVLTATNSTNGEWKSADARITTSRDVTGASASVQTDNRRIIWLNSGTAFDFTLDQLTTNTIIDFVNIGAGTVTFINGTDVTLVGTATLVSGATATVIYRSTTSPYVIQ